MKTVRMIAAALSVAFSTSAFAQVSPGTSPLSGPKGGTGNAFMQFSGPATPLKTYTLPNASDTIATLAAVQTITGAKTFASAKLLLAGSTSGAGTLNAPAAASSYVWTLPAATDTLVGKATADTFTNKTFDTAAAGNSFSIDGLAAIANTGTGSVVRATAPTLVTPTLGAATATSINKITFTAPATSATLTIPDGVTLTGPAASGTAMTLGNAETVTGAKSFNDATVILKGATSGLTTVKAAAAAGTTTLTLPAATDTLVGKATTDTLTNKTFDTAGVGNSFSINGLAATANTGTGSVVRATSPSLTTPSFSSIVNTGTLTLPTSTDTLVGRGTTDTLTNKSFNTGGTGNVFTLNGAAFGTATQATAALNTMIGDSGMGGTKGLVPAPGAGDAAAAKYLKADGSWDAPAGGGGSGGLTNSERQNFGLSMIYQSKSFPEYRRTVNSFATGFKGASDTANGILTASSSNYTVTAGSAGATTGNVAPSMVGPIDGNFAQASKASITLGGSSIGTGTSVFHGFRWVATGTGTIATVTINITSVAASGNVTARLYSNGSGHPGTQIGTASNTVNITGAGNVTFTFSSPPSVTSGTTYWIVLDCSISSTANMALTTAAAIAGYDSGRNSTAVGVSPDNYGSSDTIKVQINYTTTTSNMTLVTAMQTADASVSSGRVLIEFDNVASPTLNTDLTVEVTCDGGSNWSSASISSVTSNSQGGRKVVESVDQACTSGTSFAARVKTLNSKNVPIYGLSLAVH
ncbi:choice-of-anchor R domain-containing protein [Bradyrhizobium sp. SYSU BS000235]|uniref:choice-of-anchor R domain-containing protein n=1 Tax=Bradyrhizobium sp. SYSU BS000235 TaxID=3411332 RepID=UPI003C71DAA2